MSILVDENTRVIVQGITGRDGSFHTGQMIEYGTKIVGGVTPGKGGQKISGVPVFNSMKEAVKNTSADASVIYVPARFAKDAILEAAKSRIKLIVCITEGIPFIDMIEVMQVINDLGVRLIGPNCPGVISPGRSKIGIMPGRIHKQGNIGVISRSGTLTYEVVYNLTINGLGQSTCIGIGGDPIIGSRYVDLLSLFEKDNDTKGIVLVGEIGGQDEQIASKYIKDSCNKPVVAFISGRTAPPGKRMGHAGAIISGSLDTARAKINALKNAGVHVVDFPWEIPGIFKDILRQNIKNTL